jgi:hypothetical protein
VNTLKGQDDGSGFGVVGATAYDQISNSQTAGLKTGVLGVAGGGSDSGALQLWEDVAVEKNLALRPAGLVGVSLGEIAGSPVGVFGATTDRTGKPGQDDPRTYGFLAGRDPVFNELAGVYGESEKQGVTGVTSTDAEFSTGVFGFSKHGGGVGVRGESVTGVAVQGRVFGTGVAGKFDGPVVVNGQVTVSNSLIVQQIQLNGQMFVESGGDIVFADWAEDFDLADSSAAEPGDVMSLDEEGRLKPCADAYDMRVVGIVSGAGNFRPAIILGRHSDGSKHVPIGLSGKAFCKVDATYGDIKVGDLLTTSTTKGHAMRASDAGKAYGAIVGKALKPLKAGRGLIPVLVALQ